MGASKSKNDKISRRRHAMRIPAQKIHNQLCSELLGLLQKRGPLPKKVFYSQSSTEQTPTANRMTRLGIFPFSFFFTKTKKKQKNSKANLLRRQISDPIKVAHLKKWNSSFLCVCVCWNKLQITKGNTETKGKGNI